MKPEGQTAQAREDGRGRGQNAVDRGWGRGKEVSLRARRHSPAPSRALISWNLDTGSQDKTAACPPDIDSPWPHFPEVPLSPLPLPILAGLTLHIWLNSLPLPLIYESLACLQQEPCEVSLARILLFLVPFLSNFPSTPPSHPPPTNLLLGSKSLCVLVLRVEPKHNTAITWHPWRSSWIKSSLPV